jgi:hypothetical protein
MAFHIDTDDLIYAGEIGIDSGQAMVGDPCYLDEWDTNKNDKWPDDLSKKVGEYSYHGASATTAGRGYGELGHAHSVVFSTGNGDGVYPVYVYVNNDKQVSAVIIDFLGEFGDEPLNIVQGEWD